MSEHVLPQVAPSAMKPPKPKSHTALRVPASPPPLEPSSSSSSTVAADRSRLMVHPPSYVATLAATKAAQPSSSTGASVCDGIHCATIEKLQMQIDTLTLEKSQMQVHMNLTSRSEATLSKQLAAVVEERNRLQQESMARADAIRVLDLEVRTAAVAKAMATRDLEVVLQRFSHLVDDVEVHGTHPALPAPPVGGHSNRSKEESERIAAFTSLNSKLQEAVNRSLQQSWEWGYRAGLTVGEESARRQRLQELEIIAWQQLCDDYVVSHNEAMMEASFDLVDADEGDLC